ncbi:uncharacterized protein LOC127851093 isoform X4 [Dreissena polymorpha]|uniref:uncharacterized protein LOC127851093 isoform X4 n=1 Tax=Dreissena polymorpha TaxID=45954 RepID=UPI002265689C|nr:uncharacterized protein LOC127851093 isoform X4 [Dreissena polymorpha]
MQPNRNKSARRKVVRFTEASADSQVIRSPSRLGYSDDIPPIVVDATWENTSQDSNREDFQLLDLNEVAEPDLETSLNSARAETETRDSGQQTDFPPTPTTPNFPPHQKAGSQGRHFVSSQKFINEKGQSAKHPYEKTVYFVQTVQSNGNTPAKHHTQTVKNNFQSPTSVLNKSVSYSGSPSTRVDSGYSSQQETIRIPGSPQQLQTQPVVSKIISNSTGDRLLSSDTNYSKSQAVSSSTGNSSPTRPISGRVNENSKSVTYSYSGDRPNNTAKMSHYDNALISPLSSARKQEKQDLQILNDRFSTYISKVRSLGEHNNRLDSASLMKQTRILEDEVATLKALYERELDVLRQDLNATSRERNNYQLQCEKNKQMAIDFESRMAVESDKNRRLVDELNQAQRKANTLETELMSLRQMGDGRVDFQHLQREMDKLIRENEDHKHRQEQESLLRTEAEDQCHILRKKLEFNEQVHVQQMVEIRERLEQSQAMIISLESRINANTKNDMAIPDVLKQVREQAEIEFKRYQLESEEKYNRNIGALKCQMDNDAHTIERLSQDKSKLQGQMGELQARIRNLEGQIMTLEHQRQTVESMIQQERTRASEQLHEMEAKVRDMQELVFSKMREASEERELHIPLKAEIEAMKMLLEEEEKRLQLPLTTPTRDAPSYTTPGMFGLPPVSTQGIYSMGSIGNLGYSGDDGELRTRFGAPEGSYSQEPIPNTEPLFTHVPMTETTTEPVMADYHSGTRYTYETTPSVNRLQLETPPRPSPRAIGPISRAKSAPVRPGSQVQVVPTNLGQGKDYFDEMFRDLTRETLYTQAHPKSSPLERPPSAPRERSGSAVRDQTLNRPTERSDTFVKETESSPSPQPERPQSRVSDHVEEPRPPRSSERPHSSVFHDYTTSTSSGADEFWTSATGDVKILEVNQDGKFVRLFNDGSQEIEFGGYMIQQNVGGHPVAVFRFPPRTKFPEESTITVWSGSQDPVEHQPPRDFVWREQHKWGTGPECTTILCKPNGQAVAWMTAAHRFTKNPYEDSGKGSPMEEVQILETAPTQGGQEVLTEMNVNLNEPKPEAVYLRREKQTPPSLTAQKHPHGTSPGTETHPHTGQPRPFLYGNDNSSVNRQSRVQTTRPDPIAGQPYAGGSGNRIGSAPLRKYKSTAGGGTIRGSGAIANRSAGVIRHGPPSPFLSPKQQEYSQFRDSRPLEPGMTSVPPNPFQTPRKRFETGLEQVQSQHHVHFNPPMPRPPLFSTW